MSKLGISTSIIICLSNFIGFAQETWRIVGDSNYEKVHYFNVSVYNDTIYTHTSSINTSGTTPFVETNFLEYNSSGNIINEEIRGDSNETFVLTSNYRSIIDSAKSFLIGGFRYPSNPQLGEPRGYKIIDNEYNTVLSNYLPLQADAYGYAMYFNQLNEDSLILLCSYSTPSTFNNLVLFILDNTGAVLNSLELHSAVHGAYFNYDPSNLLVIDEHIYIITSLFYQNNIQDPSNLMIFKLDMDLNILDTYQTTNNRYYFNDCSAAFPNGDFVVGGVYSDGWDNDGVWMQKYVRKFDEDLNVLWTKLIGTRSKNTGISKLIITQDGGIAGSGVDGFVTVTLDGDSVGHISGCVFKLTSDGDSVFFQQYYALHHPLYGDENVLWDLAEMQDGGFVACGTAKIFFPQFLQRGWIMRVGPDGYLEGNDVGLQENDISSSIFIYPNPTHNEFHFNEPEKVRSYQIYDPQGNLLFEDSQSPVDIKNYSSGMYLVRLHTTSNEILTQKILKK